MIPIAPPKGWVILRKAGYFYPAYILTESPRTYALVMTKHLWRSKFAFEANELATAYHDHLPPKAVLVPIGKAPGFVIYTEAVL